MTRFAPILSRRPGARPPTVQAGTLWPNGYAYRSDLHVDPAMVSGPIAGVRAWLEVDVSVTTEEAGNVRLEDANGNQLSHRVLAQDAQTAWLRVKLPALSSTERTVIAIYTGKEEAEEEDAAGLYAGAYMAIDPITGHDLTGQGRDMEPAGVASGLMSDGWPAGIFDGSAFLSSIASAATLNGLTAWTMSVDIDAGAANDGTSPILLAQGDIANDALDGLRIRRLAVTSGGAEDVWAASVYTTASATCYTLGAAQTAQPGPALLAATWETGAEPDLYLDGELVAVSDSRPLSGAINIRTAGWYVGSLFHGAIGEILVLPEAMTPLQVDLEARSRRRPATIWGVGAWRQVEDPEPCVAMPVRVEAELEVETAIAVLASALGSSLSVVAVTQGQRGTVTLVAGAVAYTSDATGAGADWFTFTIEDGYGFQSTGRVDVTITVDPEPPAGNALQLPTPLSTVTTSVGNLATAVEAAPTGRHILCPAGSYGDLVVTVNNGTKDNPVIIRPETAGAAVTIGRIVKEGSGVLQVWGCTITQPGADGAAAKLVRVNNTGGKGFLLAWCRLNVRGIGLEANGFSAYGVRAHRCHFVKIDIGNSDNGQEAIKAGTNGTYRTDLAFVADWCFFEGFGGANSEREWFKMASANCRVSDCHAPDCRDCSFRGAWNCIVERCRFGGSGSLGRITLWGPDHIVRNVVCSTLYVCPGTVDGDAIVNGTGGLYRSAKRALLQRVSAASIQCGNAPFDSGSIAPESITGSDLSPSPTGPVAVGSAASVPAETPPTLTASDVGPPAYATMVTGA